MNKSLLCSLTVLWLLTLAACTPVARLCEPCCYPQMHLTMDAEGETVVRFGVCNIGSADFSGDADFAGELCLYDEMETLLSRRKVESLGPVPAQETVLPGQLTVDLPAGRYHLTYYTKTCGYTRADFYVTERDGVRRLRTPLLLAPLSDSTGINTD